ncbi:MAG TPA: hypothetical protein VKS21_07925, partial [Spirochaetota bacterium]|nr:hypothetical protein [Spirochaetota bacterium]
PWTSGYLQGIIDVPFISLTPGTRDGIIQDDKFQCATENIKRVEAELKKYIGMHKEAEEGKDNKNTMRTVKKTLLNAFADIPGEEYDWLDVYRKEKQKQAGNEKKNGINNNVCG